MVDPSDYVARNRAHRDANAPRYAINGERNWSQEPSWGIWDVPEEGLGLLPRDLTGLDTIELGCGTAYASAPEALAFRPTRRRDPPFSR